LVLTFKMFLTASLIGLKKLQNNNQQIHFLT
jgi:hypothetical protein